MRLARFIFGVMTGFLAIRLYSNAVEMLDLPTGFILAFMGNAIGYVIFNLIVITGNMISEGERYEF